MKVGSLVELVKGFNITSPLYLRLKLPVKNVVYTVRSIIEEEGAALLLEEIVNPTIHFHNGVGELCFEMDCFRELQPPIHNIEEHINENTLEPVYI